MFKKLTVKEMLDNEILRNKATQSRLEQENEELKAKLQAANDVAEYQEELIVELAMKLY